MSDTEITVTVPDATAAADGAAALDTNLFVYFTDPADPDNPVQALPATLGHNLIEYLFGAPVIDSITPQAGPLSGGNTVTITGSGFENPDLTFDKAEFDPTGDTDDSELIDAPDTTVVSDTEITVTVPDATAAADGAAALDTNLFVYFTDPADPDNPVQALPATLGHNLIEYLFGAPVIDSITPQAGPLSGGNTVTITGSGFENPDLTFDKAEFDPTGDTDDSELIDAPDTTVVSDTEITVTVPDATAAADGAAALDTNLFVDFTDPADPDNPVQALPATLGHNLIEYLFGAPVIDSITPQAGPLSGGNTVTITGSGFENPDLTFDKAEFDPTGDTDDSELIDAPDTTVVSDTEITVTVPDATAAADGAAALDTNLFVYFTDPADPDNPVQALPATLGHNLIEYLFGAPVIDSITPQAGPLSGGNTVTITGSGFENPDLTFDKAEFDPTGDTDDSELIDAPDTTVVSDTEITVTVPDATAAADGAAALDTNLFVYFTDPADPDNPVQALPATLGHNLIEYLFGAPVIDSITPQAGPLSGGNTVTITGSGFENPDLTFDKAEFDPTGDTDDSELIDAPDTTVVSDTEITVTVPDATAAADGAAALDTNLFVYFTDPADPDNPVQALPATLGHNLIAYSFGALGQDLSGQNLSGEDLSGDDLAGANLSDTNLTGTNLSGADLSGAELAGAIAGGANLSGANLDNANLAAAAVGGAAANLTGADLSDATLGGLIGSGANLSDANLDNANLSAAAVGGAAANLTGADLSDATLGGLIGSGANLSGANLDNANLSAAALGGAAANLTGANLSRTLGGLVGQRRQPVRRQPRQRQPQRRRRRRGGRQPHRRQPLPHLVGGLVGLDANLSGANLDNANLSAAAVGGAAANLTGANLSLTSLAGLVGLDANLSGANLDNANLSAAALGGAAANLSGANLSLTSLAGLVGLDANLSGANLDNANLSAAAVGGAAANLSGANLSLTSLAGLVGLDANLSGANLDNANLSAAALGGAAANLSGANLTDATLGGLIGSGANLYRRQPRQRQPQRRRPRRGGRQPQRRQPLPHLVGGSRRTRRQPVRRQPRQRQPQRRRPRRGGRQPHRRQPHRRHPRRTHRQRRQPHRRQPRQRQPRRRRRRRNRRQPHRRQPHRRHPHQRPVGCGEFVGRGSGWGGSCRG